MATTPGLWCHTCGTLLAFAAREAALTPTATCPACGHVPHPPASTQQGGAR